jgi:hypothetical protein
MEEKRNNKGLIIALIIFIVISLVLGGYIVYDKVLKTENNSQSNEVIEKENTSTNNKTDNTQKTEINLTSEQAFKLIESKRKESNGDNWSTLKAKVLEKGDNNYYFVTYTQANLDGYDSPLGVIFHYEDGEWKFELPGMSGRTEELISKYNFIDVSSEEYFELNDDLAYILIEGKRRELGYNTWTTESAKVIKKGDDNYYWVTYTDRNNDGNKTTLGVIFHYENGKWEFELPGFSGTTEDEMSKYNFKDIN